MGGLERERLPVGQGLGLRDLQGGDPHLRVALPRGGGLGRRSLAGTRGRRERTARTGTPRVHPGLQRPARAPDRRRRPDVAVLPPPHDPGPRHAGLHAGPPRRVAALRHRLRGRRVDAAAAPAVQPRPPGRALGAGLGRPGQPVRPLPSRTRRDKPPGRRTTGTRRSTSSTTPRSTRRSCPRSTAKPRRRGWSTRNSASTTPTPSTPTRRRTSPAFATTRSSPRAAPTRSTAATPTATRSSPTTA